MYTEAELDLIFSKAEAPSPLHAIVGIRFDSRNREIHRDDYARYGTLFGWEVGHDFLDRAAGGPNELWNLAPEHWLTNLDKKNESEHARRVSQLMGGIVRPEANESLGELMRSAIDSLGAIRPTGLAPYLKALADTSNPKRKS